MLEQKLDTNAITSRRCRGEEASKFSSINWLLRQLLEDMDQQCSHPTAHEFSSHFQW
jgi:hypothetical protein